MTSLFEGGGGQPNSNIKPDLPPFHILKAFELCLISSNFVFDYIFNKNKHVCPIKVDPSDGSTVFG